MNCAIFEHAKISDLGLKLKCHLVNEYVNKPGTLTREITSVLLKILNFRVGRKLDDHFFQPLILEMSWLKPKKLSSWLKVTPGFS